MLCFKDEIYLAWLEAQCLDSSNQSCFTELPFYSLERKGTPPDRLISYVLGSISAQLQVLKFSKKNSNYSDHPGPESLCISQSPQQGLKGRGISILWINTAAIPSLQGSPTCCNCITHSNYCSPGNCVYLFGMVGRAIITHR